MKNQSTIKINGVVQNVTSEVIDKKLWFKIEDKIYSYDLIELLKSSHVKNKSHSKSLDKVVSPMPGKITKVFVVEGQIVKKGDAMIVMEAMKMEYTLKSDIAATVEKINAQLDEQVPLGYLLIQLKVGPQ